MWIFTTLGFVSAVRDNQTPGHMLLRFRRQEHAEAYRKHILASQKRMDDRHPGWPSHNIAPSEIRTTPPPADYRYKFSVTLADWVSLCGELAEESERYTNFKGACHHAPAWGQTGHTLHQVWAIMERTQPAEQSEPQVLRKRTPKKRKKLGIVDSRTPAEKEAEKLSYCPNCGDTTAKPEPDGVTYRCTACNATIGLVDTPPPVPHKGRLGPLGQYGGDRYGKRQAQAEADREFDMGVDE